MTVFPIVEADINRLARTIISGISDNPEVFPHVNVDVLEAALNEYQTAKNNQVNARGEFIGVTTRKNVALSHLKDVMQTLLKQAEVDTIANPKQLQLIGWESSNGNNYDVIPGQPMKLISRIEGSGAFALSWQAPSDGGAVRAYLIYRRNGSMNGDESQEWILAATSFTTDANLSKQPRGVQLSYHVTAVNPAGESPASDILVIEL
jgi:hypothetical protein